ncbi:MAG TPA: glycosyltransferase family 39 protein [Nitrolancea sp.]|nr:glycosyltransferase family 39 protein [Nitrolancea sp.]
MQKAADSYDGHLEDREHTSVLDHPLSLTSLSWLSVGWVAVAVVAFLLRVMNFSALPLSLREATLASNALSIVQGGTIPAAAGQAPFPTAMTALALFLFGSSDGIVRIVPLLAGLGSLALIWWLGRWFGRRTALATAALVAISPTFVQASHDASAGGLLIFSSLLTLAAGLAWLERGSGGAAAFFGIGAALIVMSDPVGWIALPLVVIALVLLSGNHSVSSRAIVPVVLGAIVTIVLISTSLFVHPSGFSDFFRESLRGLWNQRLTNLGETWPLAFFQVVIDETVAVGLAILAVVFAWRERSRDQPRDPLVPGLLAWTILGLIAGTLLGGKNVPLYTLTALPLLLLAGAGLEALTRRVNWSDVVTPRGLLFIIALPITFFAALSTYGLLSSDVGTDAVAWIFTFVLVAIVIFAPLLALSIWIGRSMPVQAWALVAIFFAIVLAGIGLRAAALLPDTTRTRSGEPLTVGNSTPAVGTTVKQILAVSRDMTTFSQDARDPTGGHGLSVAVDSTIAQPFAWYFRDFPVLQIVKPNEQYPASNEPQVVIMRPDHPTILASDDGRLQRTMTLSTVRARSLENPDWGDLFASLIHPDQWDRFPHFLVDRSVTQPAAPTNFVLSLRQDVVTKIYGTTPPAGN